MTEGRPKRRRPSIYTMLARLTSSVTRLVKTLNRTGRPRHQLRKPSPASGRPQAAKSSHPKARSSPKVSGRVKWFNRKAGYGFLLPNEPGPDIFVHHSNIQGPGNRRARKGLVEGQCVDFILSETKRGPAATGVSVLSDSETNAQFFTPPDSPIGPSNRLERPSGADCGEGGAKLAESVDVRETTEVRVAAIAESSSETVNEPAPSVASATPVTPSPPREACMSNSVPGTPPITLNSDSVVGNAKVQSPPSPPSEVQTCRVVPHFDTGFARLDRVHRRSSGQHPPHTDSNQTYIIAGHFKEHEGSRGLYCVPVIDFYNASSKSGENRPTVIEHDQIVKIRPADLSHCLYQQKDVYKDKDWFASGCVRCPCDLYKSCNCIETKFATEEKMRLYRR